MGHEKRWQWRQLYIPLFLMLNSPLCLDCSLRMGHHGPVIIKTKEKENLQQFWNKAYVGVFLGWVKAACLWSYCCGDHFGRAEKSWREENIPTRVHSPFWKLCTWANWSSDWFGIKCIDWCLSTDLFCCCLRCGDRQQKSFRFCCWSVCYFVFRIASYFLLMEAAM